MDQFGPAAASTEAPTGGDPVVPVNGVVNDDGQTKIASGGDGMKSLTDIYLAIAETDLTKEAGVAAGAPEYQEPVADDATDFAKMAEAIAEAEASEVVEEDGEIIKVAQEYDSAGRIMARGFYDEFMKLAGALDTDVASNQMTESPSEAATPSLGDRGLPTVETNFAGNDAHDGKIETAGPGPKTVYKDSLKPKKTISAGQGTGDDPEAAAVSLGQGSPAGFATVKDLQA
jgi:hypothetical protein